MAKKRKFTAEEKKEYAKKKHAALDQASKDIKAMTEKVTANPEVLSEYLAFSARFYNYSARNITLIQNQRGNATFCASYATWKKMGYSVEKGEKGIHILVPCDFTYLVDGDRRFPISSATEEEMERYKKGELKETKVKGFIIGNTFDIAQTNFPPEKYPELIGTGVPSEKHQDCYQALNAFSEKKIGVKVVEEDIQGMALRGYYSRQENKIAINNSLKATEKLSTLTHEMGHAILHSDKNAAKKSEHRKEMEADALSIMLNSYMGLEVSDLQKIHLYEHYQKMNVRSEEKEKVILEITENCLTKFKEISPEIEKFINHITVDDVIKNKEKTKQTGKTKKKEEEMEM